MESRKHTFENVHNFVQSLTDKPIGDKLLIFPDKVVHVWISRQKPRGIKSPGVALGLANARPPELTMSVNAPQLPGGGGWAQLELTDALREEKLADTAFVQNEDISLINNKNEGMI